MDLSERDGSGGQPAVVAARSRAFSSLRRILPLGFFGTAPQGGDTYYNKFIVSDEGVNLRARAYPALRSRQSTLLNRDIIKLFSVMAVVLMPPTLIASVYGMNFKLMPELEWVHGYPMALVMMLLAAVLPYVFFKWKKWL